MKYIFILGANPTLSIAEINSILPGAEYAWPQNQVLLVETKNKLAPNNLITRLGGTIKIGEVIGEVTGSNGDEIIDLMIRAVPETSEKKFLFGISNYETGIKEFKLGLELKNKLKNRGINCRLVTSRDKALSSVVVTQNKLVGPGIEFLLIKRENKIVLAKTLAVQPFKELSYRDYGRPARDDRSGMLPPKLAQIMINLAQSLSPGTILDPFCGSGTILTEAMLIGYRNMIGTDISKKAVDDTKKNIEWTKSKFRISNFEFRIFIQNVQELSKHIKPNSIGAIITEPYLGPQRGRIDVKKTIQELNELYGKSIAEFKKLLKPSGRVVMIWPVFQGSRIGDRLSPTLGDFKIANPISLALQKSKFLKLTNRQTIIYGRPNQRVWREIVSLTLS